MTDDALVEADRLEEDGRWEEAAVLRLDTRGGATDCLGGGVGYQVDGAEVRVLPGILRVELLSSPTCLGYWLWERWGGVSGGVEWSFTPAPYTGDRTRTRTCPPEVRRAVEEAVRQALGRRFGGGT